MANADVGVHSRANERVDAELVEQKAQSRLEKRAVAALLDGEIALLGVKQRRGLRLGGAGDAVIAPEQQLAIETGDMGVVREDDGDACAPGSRRNAGGVLNCGQKRLLERGSRRVAKLVDHEQCRLLRIEVREVEQLVVVLVSKHCVSLRRLLFVVEIDDQAIHNLVHRANRAHLAAHRAGPLVFGRGALEHFARAHRIDRERELIFPVHATTGI